MMHSVEKLAQLSPQQRQIYHMRQGGGLTFAQIAKKVDLCPGRVCTIYRDTLQKLDHTLRGVLISTRLYHILLHGGGLQIAETITDRGFLLIPDAGIKVLRELRSIIPAPAKLQI